MAFFNDFATRFPLVGLHTWFETRLAVVISYCVPVGVVTIVAILLVMMLYRREHSLDASLVRLLMRWSVAFALVSVLAFPVFTQDFWLSMAWGRMAADGINPYHNLFTDETLAGLPLDHFPMVMSYGPAWAILSGLIMAVTGNSLLAATILFKAVLLVAWLGSLKLIERIMAARPLLDQCLAITVAGWMPLGVLQTVAEGHNDMVMVWLALLWLALLLQRSWLAPVSLMGSALSKYVTAPLFLVDTVVAWRLHGLSWRQLVLRLVAPGLLGLAVLGIFYRSPEFFDGTRLISEWQFMQPRHALEAIEDILGIQLYPAEQIIAIAFALVAVYWLVELVRKTTFETIIKSSLAIMAAISFVGIAHLWPWYLVWTIALAALLPRWWLSRFVIGVSIAGAFSLTAWWIDPIKDGLEWASLAVYVVALLWCFLTRPPVIAPSPVRAASSRAPVPARDNI
jgi:alpha-1,6-mannosyltransferase